MERINIKYYKFNYRFWISSGEIFVLFFVLFLEFFIISLPVRIILIINLMISPFFILLTFRNFIGAKIYVTQIEIDETTIYISMVEYNRMLNLTEIPLADFRIDIKENFLEKFLHYKLVFKRKSLTKRYEYEIIHKQHEIGDWTMEKQKEVYTIIKKKQGKFSGTASITRSIFENRKTEKHKSTNEKQTLK